MLQMGHRLACRGLRSQLTCPGPELQAVVAVDFCGAAASRCRCASSRLAVIEERVRLQCFVLLGFYGRMTYAMPSSTLTLCVSMAVHAAFLLSEMLCAAKPQTITDFTTL